MNKKENSVKAVSTVFYVASIVVLVVGIALLATNIYNYKSTVDGYVSQGYEMSMVTKLLIPQVLLPGILEPVGIMFGLALLLFGVGVLNQKIRMLLHPQEEGIETLYMDEPEFSETDQTFTGIIVESSDESVVEIPEPDNGDTAQAELDSVSDENLNK